MNRIAIDMSPLVHGSRAVRRCTICMVSELVKREDIQIDLLYIDYKFQTAKYLRPLAGDRIREKVVPLPYRLLIPAWKTIAWPLLETILPGYDIFYTNEFYFPPAKNALVLATIHGLAYRTIPEKMSSQTSKLLEEGLSFVLSHADYLVAVSETTKRELISHVGVNPERIYVVTHGVDEQFRRQGDQEEVWNRLHHNYGLNHRYILYVGAIGIHKNIMGILSAYHKLARKISHNLVLAGPPDSAWDSAHRFVAEHHLSERVHFLGYVDQTGNNLVDLYNGADLFVFPSFSEGWTSPPLEAMACGTPVITSNCSSLPETVGNAAMQVNPNNYDELANVIEKVLSDETLQSELIKKGFHHVGLHTWENAAAKMIEVFIDIRKRGPWENKRK